jgi:hypothetical protein
MQFIRWSISFGAYDCFLDWVLLLIRKLFLKLKSSLRLFYGGHLDLVNRSGISVSQMTTDMDRLS